MTELLIVLAGAVWCVLGAAAVPPVEARIRARYQDRP